MDATQGNTVLPELTPEELAANAAANAQDDDDFLAAFNDATGTEPDTEGSTSSATATAPAAAEAPAPAPQDRTTTTDDEDDLETDPATGSPLVQPGPAAEDDLDAPVTITRRQLAEMQGLGQTVQSLALELRKTVDSTNGRIGSIQQTLKEVSAKAAAGIRPSFDQMEELEEELPEIAAILKRTLERSFGVGNATEPGSEGDPTASGADAPGAAVVDPLESPQVRAILREKELAIVDATHKGWRQLPATAEWQVWQQQLPPTAQHVLATATDSATLNDALDDFKDWAAKRKAAASVSNQRGKRLEHSMPATTGTATAHRPAPSEDDEFDAGFNSVAGRRR